VEVVLKSRQLRGQEREYLVKWKIYHPIEASWMNESDMEHAQEAIKKSTINQQRSKRNIGCDENITFLLLG
jgi:hypothetical protein